MQEQPRRIPSEEPRVPLDDLIITDQLRHRPARAADHAAESRALSALLEALTEGGRGVLQQLAESALRLCRAGSAGVSILEREGEREVFRWHAAAGDWTPFLGETMPRHASPCGAVLDRGATLLMSRPERHFRYDVEAAPPIVETLLVPFRVKGKPVGTVWVVAHDVERRFDAEDERLLGNLASCAATCYDLFEARDRAERSSRATTAFLSTMSHELRNPINVIRCFLDLMEDEDLGPLTSRQREALAPAKKTVSHLAGIIEDILTFARADSGKVQLHVEEIDVAEATQGVVEMYRGKAERKRLGLRLSGADEPVRLHWDARKLRHILMNLVGNAVKYTAQGSVHVEVERRASGQVAVHVRDSGPGIPTDRLERIFEPFESAPTPGESEGETGTGLGLPVARSMARALGGDVTVDSRPGGGSAFTLWLKSQPTEGPSPSEEGPHPEVPSFERARRKRRGFVH